MDNGVFRFQRVIHKRKHVFPENDLLGLVLQHLQVVEESQHVLWRFLNYKQRLEARKYERRELTRR